MKNFTIEQDKCIHFYPNKLDLKQHLLIEAGAGAGKTAVLTERTKWLLSNKKLNISPSQLFIVTFSKDAASQIQERVEKELSQIDQLSDAISFIHISTIDSFFSELVNCIYPTWWESSQKRKNLFSMPPRLQLIDEEIICNELYNSIQNYLITNNFSDHQLSLTIDFLLSGALKKGFNNNRGTLDSILKTLCDATFLAASSEELRIAAKKIHPSTQILIHEFHRIARLEYEKRIIKGEFTYSDRTLFLKENLKHNVPIQLQELIVDEYQDTNQIQHDILFNMVHECNGRMVVVGDPKQSIYGFRNASVDVFQNLKNNKSWEHIELKKNFRSNPDLLNEINHLSKLAFQWENPKFPDEFKKSYFYEEAIKKYTPENALDPGKTSNNFNNEKYIHIVTASLNEDRFTSNNQNGIIIDNQLKLEKYSIECYVSFIKNYQKINDLKWKDMVILCEENNDAFKIVQSLKKASIPVLYMSKNEKDLESNLEFLVALSLAKSLLNEEDNLDIYHILHSPLSFMSHSEIENYFFHRKNNKIINNEMIQKIEEHKIIAKDNFFKAWQLLRWQFVKMHKNINSKTQASLFCARMDLFSYALAQKLESPTFRESLEEKVKNNLDNSILKKNTTPLFPTALSQWRLDSWESESTETDNLLEVKTVHKAKGLEWKHVIFYPKHGRAKNLGKFVSSNSGRFLDITWLQDDTENLSVVHRIENKYFSDTDSFIEYKTNGDVKSAFFFPELRKQAEQDFERQRVFYTAFTRAENAFILLQPKRLKKDGIRDDLGKITHRDPLPFQKYLEEDIFLKYLDHYFNLRGFPKPKGKLAKTNEAIPPPEPWFQNDETYPNPYLSENKFISYYEYGPHFLENIILNEAKIDHFTKENHSIKSLFSLDYFLNKYPFLEDSNLENLISETEVEANKESLELKESNSLTKYSNLRNKIENAKKSRDLINKGILYHAAAENKKAPKKSLQYLIESTSIQVFHEFEIWLKTEDKNHFLNTSRHIIDFLAILTIENFLKLPFQSFFSIKEECHFPFQTTLKQYKPSSLILFVIDYKTGKKENDHIKQILRYIDLTKSLSNLEYFYGDRLKETEFITLGGLCYNKKSETSSPLKYMGKDLPSSLIFEEEQVFLFV
ncbi:UvrD-helicase domain-containing protein [Silvanigrella sp.]|jgi:ATP-dependent exoDNAse (exonuclease V) beta subunit|uniref:UvrD-helicase domain-containing protein n=1 Tax=Silvanigrella sp. TaxID=2024976 RepID=UPI0037C8DCDC